jgi:hypothetical protein
LMKAIKQLRENETLLLQFLEGQHG